MHCVQASGERIYSIALGKGREIPGLAFFSFFLSLSSRLQVPTDGSTAGLSHSGLYSIPTGAA